MIRHMLLANRPPGPCETLSHCTLWSGLDSLTFLDSSTYAFFQMFTTRSFSHQTRAQLLYLPSSVRAQLYQHGLSRSFSVSAPRHAGSLLDLAITPPMTVLNVLHDAGLPWYAVIPATAVVVRGVFGYYLGTKPAHRRAEIRSNLVPLVSAHVLAENKLMFRKRRRLGGEGNDPTSLKAVLSRLWRLHKTGKEFGAPLLTWSGWLNFAALIATTEAIRLKTGASNGLLKVLLLPVETVAASFGAGQARREGEIVSSSVESSDTSSSLPDAADSPYFDPSVCVEGLPWCLDLSVADPLQILPFSLLFLTTASIVFRPGRGMTKGALSFFQSFTAGEFWMMAFAFVIVSFGQHLPAGIFLYFVSSNLLAKIQQIWLHVRHPIAPPITPCRLPPRRRMASGLRGT